MVPLAGKQTNKQTNKHSAYWWGAYTAQTKPLLPARQSCGSPPLWPRPSSPLAVGTKPLLCACFWESAWENIKLIPSWLRLRPSRQGEVGQEDGAWGGGWALMREQDDGWGVCGNHALTRLSTCEKGQCTANLQCKSTPLLALFGKSASIAGTMQASGDGKCHSHFDSWLPLFPKVSPL